VTKSFTAAAILKLREAGLLQMNSKPKTLSDDGYVLLAAIIEETSGRA
jgi:CubicO group peptidase (beta-lactamase class C family)